MPVHSQRGAKIKTLIALEQRMGELILKPECYTLQLQYRVIYNYSGFVLLHMADHRLSNILDIRGYNHCLVLCNIKQHLEKISFTLLLIQLSGENENIPLNNLTVNRIRKFSSR